LANIWLRRQIIGSVSSSNLAFAAAPWANNWLRRKIVGSVGKFGFCGSSVGKYLASSANICAPSANSWLHWQIRLLWQLRRQIFGSSGSASNNLSPSANMASCQLSWQIFGSIGK
jgi:hypothetical protein